jgi:hypothetical protein
MAATYEPIATTTLGSNQTSVSFTSFSGYTDLIIIANVKGNDGSTCIRFNSDSGSNYSWARLAGYGSSASSASASNTNVISSATNISVNAGDFQTCIFHINDYENTTTYKTVLMRDGIAAHGAGAVAGLWRNTAAITSLSIAPEFSANVYYAGSTITLYGIKAA